MHVGFAGLGRMGVPMGRRLAGAGFDLIVWNRTANQAQTFAGETGCSVAERPRDLAEACNVVVSMLTDDAASEAFHLGDHGV